MTSTADALKSVHLLSNLNDAEREVIAKECVVRRYPKGQTVFDKDEDNRDILFVMAGSVDITGYSLSGREISFDRISAGDHFGELAAIDGEPRSATAVTSEKCELASLPLPAFHRLLADHPQVALTVMHRLAQVIRISNERIMDFATLSAHQRVCAEILRLAKPDPDNPEGSIVHPMPTQTAIASRIGASRETVARIMGELNRGELMVRRKRNFVVIPNTERFELLTERLADDW